MPGIITHNKILKDSIRLLETRSKKTYLLRSLQALFSSESHRRAALFGAVGPNILDYIPVRNKKKYYGHEISFFLHNGGGHAMLSAMLDTVNSAPDKNTEWAAKQRAYFYGLLSHYIADSFIHPFVFYFSGFSTSLNRNDMRYYREQNLLHQYNIDSYYEHYTDDASDFSFSLREMLPVEKKHGLLKMDSAVKNLILGSFKSVYPELHNKILLRKKSHDSDNPDTPLSLIDLVPYFMLATYWLKRSRNSTISSLIKSIYRRGLVHSDFIVRYPAKKKINRDLLNLHRGRWQHPDGRAGYRYDSIDELISQACGETVSIWERIEGGLYGHPDSSVMERLRFNAYTGETDTYFEEMKHSSPVKLNLYSKF